MWTQFKETNFFKFITIFLRRFKSGNVSNNGIVFAYYTLLSFFPLLLLIGNLLPLLNLPIKTVLEYVQQVMPENIYEILSPLIRQLLTTNSGGIFSIGVVVAIWSASRGISAFQKSLDATYEMENSANAILSRLLSFVIVLIFMLALVVVVLFFTLSSAVLTYLTPILHLPQNLVGIVSTVKWPITIIAAVIILAVLYVIVPTAKVYWRFVWVGAAFSMVGLLLLTQFFALYLRYFGGEITTYRTIGTFIVIMLWLDLFAEILLIGGVINASLQEGWQKKAFIPKKRRSKRQKSDKLV
ncbi:MULTISPECIES: YihY/virulence factor BrkB family protein [Pediococcus]|jgi:membrane protein|uniref:YihY family inner membrane protein n=1 Tax=Pediococcus parvulus TaxID=54062 RepID=A0A176TIS1_9LACO|nr:MULTISPECIES: YihY/virulence factor BrkB family protein [Pediococcus]MCT3027087.1 YihY/virulence factor BrkB family protein [Pediococcus parvulus]MCT3028760.1 YihY/virulence factor BrkB family protein [Pediococcus parvulus]MCT3035520.1 YihY/virulence factor BrkB family protein [Pediococcus parvulus]MDN5575742.1 YihY/virulence factor BrkB family protein [Pediococcus sp.]MDV7694457.1 YihY family inner membrane protein [Pediococcus parvulus]